MTIGILFSRKFCQKTLLQPTVPGNVRKTSLPFVVGESFDDSFFEDLCKATVKAVLPVKEKMKPAINKKSCLLARKGAKRGHFD